MKSTLLLITTLLSVSAFSETATLTVDGMHCSGCKKMVTKAVCKDAKIAETLENCEVTVDEKIEQGTVVLKAKDSKTIDMAAVEAAITGAGEYKISKKDIKAETAAVESKKDAKKETKK
jgi:hypothetical protein